MNNFSLMIEFIAGIDEAGRGPIIGPLVMAVAAIPKDKHETLRSFGVKDSKLLSEKQREEIFKAIEHMIHFELVIIQPSEIDEAVNSQSYNLNWLEADKAAALLNKLDVKLDNNVVETLIDCPSTNISAYTAYFQKNVDNKDIKLTVEHKADLHHLIVGAASIIAKVTREKELEKLKRKLKIDFGSGYPADPKTKEFLKDNYANPLYKNIIRKSWATYKTLANKNNQSSLDGF